MFGRAFLASGQADGDYLITHHLISMEEGLSSREVFCAAQDPEGFMWFGTRNGLNRYDGTKFLLFNRDKGGLRNNRIVQLATDTDSLLFIAYGSTGYKQATNGEIDVMNIRTQQTRTLTDMFPAMPFKEREVYIVSNDGTGEVSFVTEHPAAVWKYRPGKGFRMAEKYPVQGEGASEFGWLSVFQNGQCILNFGSVIANSYVDAGRAKLRTILLYVDSLRRQTILSEHTPGKWQLRRVSNHDTTLVTQKVFGFPDGNKLKFRPSVGESSCIIYGPKDGIILFRGQESISLLPPEAMPAIGSIFVSQSFVDARGIRWLCTSTGILKISLVKNRFTHYFARDQQQVEANNQARGIYVTDSGKIIAAIWRRLMISDQRGLNTSASDDNMIYPVLVSGGDIYTGGDHLFKYDPRHARLVHIDDNVKGQIWALHRLSDSSFIVGCMKGVFIYYERSKRYIPAPSLLNHIPEVNVACRFYHRKNGQLVLAAQNGLFGFNRLGEINSYTGKDNNWNSKKHWPDIDLFDAWEDEQLNLWLATSGNGLLCYNPKLDSLTRYTVTEGLPSDILYRIEPDEAHGYLWVSSDNGLIRFNMRDHAVRTYTARDGLTNNEFNRLSSYKAPDGRLFFGGLNGVNAFNPRSFDADRQNNAIPLKVTNYLQYSGAHDRLEDRTNSVSQDKGIVMHVGDRFFTIEYTLLDFETHADHYAYRIDGVDRDWNYVNGKSIRISGLPYGDFTMHIKGQLLDGQWSTAELRIPIRVIRPFYTNWWFLLLISGLLIALVFLFIKLRTRRLVLEKANLEKIVGERTEQLSITLNDREVLLREIHHRVKNNLQVISALQQLQSTRTKDPLVKAQLEESQNRVLSIAFIHQNLYQHNDLKGVEMQSFVRELTGHILAVCIGQEKKIVVTQDIAPVTLDIDTAVPLGLIINELLTNSCKHAFRDRNEGRIFIRLMMSAVPGNYLLEYDDDGPGLNAALDLSKADSLGLKLISQLAEQLDGTLQYQQPPLNRFVLTFKDFETRSAD